MSKKIEYDFYAIVEHSYYGVIVVAKGKTRKEVERIVKKKHLENYATINYKRVETKLMYMESL